MPLVTFVDASGNEVVVSAANPLPSSGAGGGGGIGTNAVPSYSKGAYATTTDSIAQSVNAVATNMAATDAKDFQSVAFQVNVQTTYTGTLTFQASADGALWVTKSLININGGVLASSLAGAAAAVGALGAFNGDIGLRYVRVIQTAWSAGQVQVVTEFSAYSLATIPVQTVTIGAGSNSIGNVTLNNGVITNTLGRVALFDGTNAVAVKAASVAAAATDASLVVQQSPMTYAQVTASITPNLAASTNGTVVKATSGTLFQFDVTNHTGTAFYFKLYNSATVTVGTTVPVDTFLVNSGDTRALDFGPLGKRFTAGICFATTAAATDADATAIVLTSGPAKAGVTYL